MSQAILDALPDSPPPTCRNNDAHLDAKAQERMSRNLEQDFLCRGPSNSTSFKERHFLRAKQRENMPLAEHSEGWERLP